MLDKKEKPKHIWQSDNQDEPIDIVPAIYLKKKRGLFLGVTIEKRHLNLIAQNNPIIDLFCVFIMLLLIIIIML